MITHHDAHVRAWVRHHARQLSRTAMADGFQPAALHEYADADGQLLYWRIRLKHPNTGDKWIRPLRRVEGGGFDLKQPEFPNGSPLYRLPELTAQPDALVWIVEGEACADALAGLGVVATTSGGADSAGRADWSILAGRAVTIWPDNDDAGRRYADTVADILRERGCAVSILDAAALDLPTKGDAVDWLAAHPDAAADDVENLPRLEKIDPPESPTSHDLDTAEGLPHVSEDDDARIARLAALSPLDYDRCRKAEAKAMGVRDATLDKMVKAARAGADEPETPFNEPEPWPYPVSPSDLFDELAATIRRFIVLDVSQADAAALWIAFTHLSDVVEVAPLAIINAPEKACGKSQLLTLFGRLVARPLPAANSTAAFLFRAVELWEPTVLIDEADTFIRDNEELKGLVNAGHTRANAYVGRVVGDDLQPKLFKVWGAKALAGIALEKHLPDATMSRAVIFNMRRKLASESVERLRHAEAGLFERLASKLERFADDCRDAVRCARPSLPDALGDREQDNWEPLFAIAGCAGPEWVRRATAAALELSGVGRDSQSAGNELLTDIQAVFDAKGCVRISMADLIAALIADDEAAWATWNRGRALTARQLGKMLQGYGIKTKALRLGYEVAKGYDRAQFADAFGRYLTPTPENGHFSVTALQPKNGAGSSVTGASVTPHESNNAVTPNPAWIKACNHVTEKTPIFGEGLSVSESVPDDDVEVF